MDGRREHRREHRRDRGAISLPIVLMGLGVIVLLGAIGYFVFGGEEEKETTATLADRCAFPACRAALDPGGGRGYEGASVAVNPNDENHMVVTDANMAAGHCMWHTTFDRGKEWIDGIFSVPGFTGCHINAGAGGHVPIGPGSVSFGPTGTVYAVYGSSNAELAADGREREAVIVGISTDGGKKFEAKVAVTPPGDDISYARPQMSVVAGPAGKDRILLSFWLCRQGGRFCDSTLFSRSDDGGATFIPPVTINDPPAGQTPSEPLQTPDGTIYITFIRRYADGPSDLVLARSTDGGATYSYVPVDNQLQIGDRYDPAKLAFDPRSNTLYTVYTDNRTQSQQVVFRKSTDRGNSWAPPIGLAPDNENVTTTGYSRSPSLSVAPNGRIDVVYYRTPQANTDNVFWSYSTDGGNRFFSRQVNDKPIQRFNYNAAIGTWYPPDVFSIDTAAVVVWSDTTNTRDQNRDAQEVFLRRMLPAGGDIPP
jgi:hypothetical protein